MAVRFLNEVQSILPADKFQLFCQLFKYPVKTNKITAQIFNDLSKVKDGRNPAFNFQFESSDDRDDWEWYRQEVLKEPTIWQDTAWKWMQTEINSIVVVDLPIMQLSDRPEPYFYWVTIDNVIDYKLDLSDPDRMMFEYIIFKVPHGDKFRYAIFDRERYRLFNACDKNTIQDIPEVDVEHGLGYTPAFFFWKSVLRMEEPGIRKSPISHVLSELDNYLSFAISKDQLDLYAPYPIYSGYKPRCDYKNTVTGDYCKAGVLLDKHGNARIEPLGNNAVKCPVCADRRIIGPGSFVEVPIPNADVGQPDLRNPIQITNIDRSSLDYNVEELARKANEIIRSCVGIDSTIVNEQAINDLQVEATYESRNTVLNEIKTNFEKIQTLVDETICRLRYGDVFIAAHISWGTEFFLFSVDELRNQYKMAKESGASEVELDSLKLQILETQFRNNPLELQRHLILSEIEPYPHHSREEVLSMNDRGLVNIEDLRMKLNFSNFVKRFERENINVIEFASLLPFDKKIQIISNTLRNYAREQSTV